MTNDFELDESIVSKQARYTVDVDESALEFDEYPKFLPKTKNPLNLNGALLLPTVPENVVIAQNYAENFCKNELLERRVQKLQEAIALQKLSEITFADYLSSKGVSAKMELQPFVEDLDSPVTTMKGNHFHVRATGVSISRRSVGPDFLIHKNSILNKFLPKHYLVGCLVSSDWKQVAVLFCVSSLDARNLYRNPLKYMPYRRAVYHVMARDLSHDERWSCLASLARKELKNAEVTDDDGLSVAD